MMPPSRSAVRSTSGDIRRHPPRTIDLRQSPTRLPTYRPPASYRRPLAATRPASAPVQPLGRTPGRARRWQPVLNWLQYPLIAAAALAAAFNSTAGQVLVGLFGVYAVVTRQAARLSFGAALFMLLTIPLFQVLGQPLIAEHAAIYVYELLVIGTILALIELRKTGNPDN